MESQGENIMTDYTVAQLKQYIELQEHITGKLPEEITVSVDFFDWYKGEIRRMFDLFGKPDMTLHDNKIYFSKVRIVKQ